MGDISVHLVDRGRIHVNTGYVLDGYSVGSASNPNPNHKMNELVA